MSRFPERVEPPIATAIIPSAPIDSLARLYLDHAPAVLRFARAFLRHDHDAEDVVHDVFIKAWESRARFDPAVGCERAWLFVICRSRMIDLLRSRKRHIELEVVSDEQPRATGVGLSPLDGACRSQRARLVRRALWHLKPAHRDAVTAAFLADLSHPEVAARMKRPLGTVKTQIRAARAQLSVSLRQLAI